MVVFLTVPSLEVLWILSWIRMNEWNLYFDRVVQSVVENHCYQLEPCIYYLQLYAYKKIKRDIITSVTSMTKVLLESKPFLPFTFVIFLLSRSFCVALKFPIIHTVSVALIFLRKHSFIFFVRTALHFTVTWKTCVILLTVLWFALIEASIRLTVYKVSTNYHSSWLMSGVHLYVLGERFTSTSAGSEWSSC